MFVINGIILFFCFKIINMKAIIPETFGGIENLVIKVSRVRGNGEVVPDMLNVVSTGNSQIPLFQ
ncbi:hypothetical protein EGI32_01955 [Ferruginibacter sp. HRS2-29]|nr:hypothetical protein [Ferruginibacter sp. HRS2-29]